MKLMLTRNVKIALLSITLGPLLATAYITVRDLLRGPFKCTVNPDIWAPCMDLRGLDDLWIGLGIWVVASVVALFYAVKEFRRSQTIQSRAILAIVVTIPSLVIVFIISQAISY
jgi:hypothetical protein